MKAKNIYIAALAAIALSNTSCEKVSPQGVLMGNTAVEDRVEMSYKYYMQNNFEYKLDPDIHLSDIATNGYSFLVGADSHITTDLGRMKEMFQIGLDNDDLLYCHLGDIADTKPDYYINLQNCLEWPDLTISRKITPKTKKMGCFIAMIIPKGGGANTMKLGFHSSL